MNRICYYIRTRLPLAPSLLFVFQFSQNRRDLCRQAFRSKPGNGSRERILGDAPGDDWGPQPHGRRQFSDRTSGDPSHGTRNTGFADY